MSERNEEEWPSTPVAEQPIPIAPKRAPQRAPRRQPTGNDAWTNQGSGAVPVFDSASMPNKQSEWYAPSVYSTADIIVRRRAS